MTGIDHDGLTIELQDRHNLTLMYFLSNTIFLTLRLPMQLVGDLLITLGAPAGIPREDSSLATANQLSMTNVTKYR